MGKKPCLLPNTVRTRDMHDRDVNNYIFSINAASVSASVKYKTEICRK